MKPTPTKPPQNLLQADEWVSLDVENLNLSFSIADSVLAEFVLSHDPSAVLKELVQNEYDAGGSRMEVTFGADAMRITGNGEAIDSQGWQRLSVMLGTGRVQLANQEIKAKVNGIGSKNFGLRSLFLYGDQIRIRSGGLQTIMDFSRGTLSKPLQEPTSLKRRGAQIEVPYRRTKISKLEPFGSEQEKVALDSFSTDLAMILMKLAQPGARKSLSDLVVSSERWNRQIVWKQSVRETPCSHKQVTSVRRRIKMSDTSLPQPRIFEELEFQKTFIIPTEYREQGIPSYFRVKEQVDTSCGLFRYRTGKD